MNIRGLVERWAAAETVDQLRVALRGIVAELRPRMHGGAAVRLAHLAQFVSGRVSSFRGVHHEEHPIEALMVAVNLHREGRRDLSRRLVEAALRRLETADDDGRGL